jgi:predicted DNA-binding protein
LNLKEIRIVMKQTKVTIDEETHRRLKVYCAKHGLLMSQFVSEIIRERIDDVDSKDSSRDTDKP